MCALLLKNGQKVRRIVKNPPLKPLVCDQTVAAGFKVFAGHSYKWPVVEGSGFGGCSHPAEPNQEHPSQPTNQRNQRNLRLNQN